MIFNRTNIQKPTQAKVPLLTNTTNNRLLEGKVNLSTAYKPSVCNLTEEIECPFENDFVLEPTTLNKSICVPSVDSMRFNKFAKLWQRSLREKLFTL